MSPHAQGEWKSGSAEAAMSLLLDRLGRSRSAARTNYFRQPLPDEGIFIAQSPASIIVLAADWSFFRLYYVSDDPGDLREMLRMLPRPGEIVVSHLYRGALPPETLEAFVDSRYESLATYQRMCNRQVKRYPHHPEIDFAREDETNEIGRLLYGVFDARTDHLPSIEALAERVRRQEVLVRRLDGRPCGFVIFAIDQATANFNYLYSECGSRRDTASLIETFYTVASERGAGRTFLWVDRRKSGVIALYRTFAWEVDGLAASYHRSAHESRSPDPPDHTT